MKKYVFFVILLGRLYKSIIMMVKACNICTDRQLKWRIRDEYS